MGCLGHAVGLEDGGVEAGLHAFENGGSQGCAAGADEPERAPGSVVAVGAGEEDLVHGWDARVPGGGLLKGHGPEVAGAESAWDDGRASAGEGGEKDADETVDVEEGHYHQGLVLLREAVGSHDVIEGRCEVGMAEGDALGSAGSAAGVEEERYVVGGGAFRLTLAL